MAILVPKPSPPPVAINFNAFDGAVTNEGIKIVRSFLPAAVFPAFGLAKLIGFRRINSP